MTASLAYWILATLAGIPGVICFYIYGRGKGSMAYLLIGVALTLLCFVCNMLSIGAFR